MARLGLELALDGRKPSARGALAAWFRWPPPPAGATGLPGNWAPLLTFARPSSLFSVSYTYPTSWLGATAITGATTLPWKFFTLFLGSPFAGSSGVNCSMSLQDHPDVFWCLPDVGEAKYRDDVWHHLLLVQVSQQQC